MAAAPLVAKKVEPKKVSNPLFEKRPKNFGIGMYNPHDLLIGLNCGQTTETRAGAIAS